MKLKLYFFLVCIMGGVALKAQDATFSQFYANPLYLNPALTGNFNGFWRATGIYRNQWLGVAKGTAPFSTPSVGVDFSLLKEQLKDKGALGVGAVFLNDQLYGKVITYNKFLVNVAYTMKVAKKVQIGVGFQGGIQTQRLKDNFNFADEVDPNTLEFSLNTSENLNSKTQIRENINAGVFVSAEFIRGMRFYTGYSINNLSRQKESYLNTGPTNRVDFRHVSHGGFEFDLGQSAVLIPGWLFSLQSKTLQTNWGLTAGIHVKKSTVPADRATLYLGLWNRVNRDYPQTVQLIPKVGFEWKGFRAGFAFDAPLGQLRKDSKAAGGGYPQAFEISLSYIGQIVIPREDNYLFNPRY